MPITTTLAAPSAIYRASALLLTLTTTAAAIGQTTGSTGSFPPSGVSTAQPSIAIHFGYQLDGIYGFGVPVRMFAYPDSVWTRLLTEGWVEPDGRLLSYITYPNTFNQINTTYGPSSPITQTFTIPDLRSRAIMGEGQAPGLANYTRNQASGAFSSFLTPANLPPHAHTLSSGGVTGFTGNSTSFVADQPALAIRPSIAVAGIFPPRDGAGSSSPSEPYVSQIFFLTADPIAQARMEPASGQTMPIAQQQALFALLGVNYGGNGTTNFKYPDLRGRLSSAAAPGGTGNPSITPRDVGFTYGSSFKTLLQSQMPAHLHTVPSRPDTGVAGGTLPFDNTQPTLAITYCIDISGAYPSFGAPMDDTTGYIGEIIAMACNFAPAGFLPCDGRLLPIQSNQALFSLLGNTYGGNGSVNFAIPDLRGRTPVMATANTPAGTTYGEEATTLTFNQLPAHTHSVPAFCSIADIAGGGTDGRRPDGIVDGTDFIVFINSFAVGERSIDPLADIAGAGPTGLLPDGIIDGNDFIAFVNAFAAGC